MGLLFVYIVKSAFCLTALYSFYSLLLSKETFHRFNRLALLFLLLTSLIIPLCKVYTPHVNTLQEKIGIVEGYFLPEVVITPSHKISHPNVTDKETIHLDATKSIICLYFAGVLFFSIKLLASLLFLYNLRIRGKNTILEDGNILILHQRKDAPFSWFHYIFISEKDYKEHRELFLIHEKAHINLNHSYDILFSQIFLIFQWFNPMVWLLFKDLQEVHEYEADKEVIKLGYDIDQYQQLLIQKAVSSRFHSFANSFHNSSIKNRFIMMHSKKSKKWAYAKYLYVVPMAALTIVAFARPELTNSTESVLNDVSALNINNLSPIQQNPKIKKEDTSVDTEKSVKSFYGIITDEDGKPISTSIVFIPIEKGTTTREEKAIYFSKDGSFNFNNKENCRFEVSAKGFNSKIESPFEKDSFYFNVSAKGYESRTVLLVKKQKNRIVLTQKGSKENNDSIIGTDNRATEDNTSATVNDEEKVWYVVEQMPHFDGGEGAMMNYLRNTIKYPNKAAQNKKQGIVVVTFIIKKDGSIANATILRSVDPLLDAEAKRVVEEMPKWTPGKQNGKAVNVKYTIPISFTLR